MTKTKNLRRHRYCPTCGAITADVCTPATRVKGAGIYLGSVELRDNAALPVRDAYFCVDHPLTTVTVM